MKSNGLLLLKYQDNFADNMTSWAYGKILENKSNRKCFFENDTEQREEFEAKMKFFKMTPEYVSKNKVKQMSGLSYMFSRKLIDETKIKKEIAKKHTGTDKILNIKKFNINDIGLLTEDIKNELRFIHYKFVIDYDVIQEIKERNSIGLYINIDDVNSGNIDFDYIKRAIKRLNKYLKDPFLYVFANTKIKEQFHGCGFYYKVYGFPDWRQGFYMLSNCKHKIILNTNASYSTGFWAAVLNQKDYGINVFDKRLKGVKETTNWIGA